MIKEYSIKKDGNLNLATNFKVKEFASPDSDRVLIDDQLVKQLQVLRNCCELSSLLIISGFRTDARNKAVGGAEGSRHTTGQAVDIQPFKNGKPMDPKYLCCAAEVIGMTGIGLIQTCAHLDTRSSASFFDENKSNNNISKYGHNSFFSYCNVTNLDFIVKNPFTDPSTVLRKGSKGVGVKWLQFILIKKGFLSLLDSAGRLNIDGIFGTDTENAVKKFQEKNQLIGIVNSDTRKALLS